jgi:hypothetical protein
MPRVKRGVTARARHKKILVQAKGYRGRRKNVYRIAKQAVMKAVNTSTATVVNGSVSSVLCGLPVSMPQRVSWA